MKKRFYTALAVSIMPGSANGLFLVMTSLSDLAGEGISLDLESDTASTASY